MSEADRSEFEAAIAAARQNPEDGAHWDRAVELAGELDAPDDVGALFREVLAGELDADLAGAIGERAASFFEEWYGDDPTSLADLLARVLELAPDADWAFQRLTLALTEAQRWDRLLAVYDRIIARTSDVGRQVELLEEASQVARDMAGDTDKAIGYLQALLPLKPEDEKLAQGLERLLEKHERWVDLIALWRTQLEDQSSEERSATRGRIASCYLDNLGDAAQALEATKEFLAEASSDAEPCALLERIVADGAASAEVRTGALDLLRYQYESTDRPAEFVRVLENAIQFDPGREKDYRSEAAQLLANLDRLEDAMNHYGALLALDPGSAATVGHLRQLAQRSTNFELFARLVDRAAENAGDPSRRVALLSAAAKTRLDELRDQGGAIETLTRALRTEDIAAADVLAVGRKLNELLAATDRNQERLEVLERLAGAESVDSTRQALMGDIARLSDSLGDSDKALQAWQARLELDGTDRVALDGAIALLERERNWESLIAALQRRVDNSTSPAERRSDSTRIARIYQSEMGDVERALQAWTVVHREFGETDESIAALTELYAKAQAWQELAQLLERASATQSSSLLDRLALLGDAYRDHLDAPGRALDCYDRILRIDPNHEGAGAGLLGLQNEPSCQVKAVDILATTYRNTDNWRGLLDLAPARLERAADANMRLGILREAARLQEQNADDLAAALANLAAAFPLAPRDPALERDLVRLARATGQWTTAVKAYRDAIEAVSGDDNATGELSSRLARILDTELDEREAALAPYRVVADLEPANHPAITAIARIGAGLGQWRETCASVIRYVRVRDRIDPALIGLLEDAAERRSEWAELVNAMLAAIDGEVELASMHAAELLTRVADWQAEHLAGQDREHTLVAVLRHEPGRRAALRQLAELRRSQPGPALFETLERIAELEPADLDVRWEAAEVAVAHVGDRAVIERALASLLGRASAAWRGTAPATGERDPRAAVEWALGELGQRYAAEGRAGAAFELFVDAARLPFPAETQRSMRVRAATIASDELGDVGSAIEMYRSILSQEPSDRGALEALGALYRKENRYAELLSLCQRELALGADDDRKLELRLEIARLVGEVEKQGNRVEALEQNLREVPGHEASVDALSSILSARNAHDELVSVLSQQADVLERSGEAGRAGALWLRAAELSEKQLGDPSRAIKAYRRVAALAPNAGSYDALARLYTDRGEPEQAVSWIERLLALDPEPRTDLVLRLADAHLDAGAAERATEVLAEAHGQGMRDARVRTRLADLYRETGRWQPLAELLSGALDEVDEATAGRYAREAAELFHERLQQPARALPAIERALQTSSDDRDLKIMKARALRAADRGSEARELLEALIADFGRRRSKERAAIHVELAYVLQAEGQNENALKEIELASKMDAGNPHLLRQVAELALAGGNNDKAEKSLRSLLLVVRRNPPAEDLDAVGESEVLYELHRLALAHGEGDKATELLESALEAAVQADAETSRLRRTLVTHGDHDTALRALEARLDVSEEAGARAKLLTEVAAILEDHKGRASDGLSRRLEALALAPERLDLHDRTVAAARAVGGISAYVQRVAEIAATLKRDADAQLGAELWMRLGRLAENDLGEATLARDYYRNAEGTGIDRAEALFSLARVCAHLGDRDGSEAALSELTAMADEQEPSPAQASALYRLAEMQVESDDLRTRGLDILRRALGVDPKPSNAARILRRAAELEPGEAAILALYEQVARASGEWEILLDFLERRARLTTATPEQIREAVELANTHGQASRGEALLERAVEAARAGDEGIAGAVWAVLALARQRLRSDARAAFALMAELGDDATQDELFALGSEIAQVAMTEQDDLRLAADVLETLRESHPARRDVWEPLANVYRRLEDHTRFMAVITTTLPTLIDPNERNALRKQSALFLIDSGDAGQAIEPLRDALLDDPDDLEAAAMLEDVLTRAGDDEGLIDFLSQRFDEARERGNPDTLADVALRLGSKLESSGAGDPLEVYRAALSQAPSSPELLSKIIDALPEEDAVQRVEMKERLLSVIDLDSAGTLALELADLRQELGDGDGALRALRIGQLRVPTEPRLRSRLESLYRESGMWRELAEMMVVEARALEDERLAVARLREAAVIHRDHLIDAAAAASVLRQAIERNPGDVGLVIELADCLRAADDLRGAATVLGSALENGGGGESRVDLLLTRAQMLGELGEHDAAAAALEDAYAVAPDRVHEALAMGLENQRVAATRAGNLDAERKATLRLADLQAHHGAPDKASDMLTSWVISQPQDAEALQQLRDLDRQAQRWPGVVTACSRLVMITHGESQIEAAHQLAEAAAAMHEPAQARQGLEFVQQVQPENGAVRGLLRQIYEQTGALRELANLLLSEASFASEPDEQYEAYRRAADIMVNQLGDAEGAIEPAQRAQEIRPEDHDTLVLLADVLTYSGRPHDAANMLVPAIDAHKRRSPELATLQHRMARIAQVGGDQDAQLGWLKKAFDVDRKNGVIAAELAQLATELQDYDLALKPLRAISLMDTPGPISRTMALLWEAKIEHARGNRAKAELWAKKALREDPEFMEAQEFLSQIQE